MKEFWNERYAEKEFVYGKAPNDFFKTQIDKLTAGKLLLPCEGEGRNAVYAAAKHWEVKAFDQSEKGKEKCLQLAHENNVIVNYQIADALEFDYGTDQYDLIALIFAHFPAAIRSNIHQKCVTALNPGGMLILEAYNPLQINNSSGGPKDTSMLYTDDMLAEDFKKIQILSIENFHTNLNEGAYHSGISDIVRLIAVK